MAQTQKASLRVTSTRERLCITSLGLCQQIAWATWLRSCGWSYATNKEQDVNSTALGDWRPLFPIKDNSPVKPQPLLERALKGTIPSPHTTEPCILCVTLYYKRANTNPESRTSTEGTPVSSLWTTWPKSLKFTLNWNSWNCPPTVESNLAYNHS